MVPRSGTDQFVFLSNYDGSWESYLEDFVTPCPSGAVGGVGQRRRLPADALLDPRWCRRRRQVQTLGSAAAAPDLVLFSRYPHLTTKQIRNNALIEDGLARAANDTDARRWLTCFGSAQREDGELEAQEAQAILFTGFGRQQYATSLFVRLPTEQDALGTWLQAVSA